MDREKLLDAYRRQYALSLDMNKNFVEQFETYRKAKGWNCAAFCDKTGLDKNIYYRLKKPDERFSLRILVTVCVAFGLDLEQSTAFLRAKGRALDPTDRIHFAYAYLISRHSGISIEDANQLLAVLLSDLDDISKYLLGSA
ncbi:hypothetical protein [Agathobaculum sp. TL06]